MEIACSVAVINSSEAAIRKKTPYYQGTARPQQNLWSFDFMLGCLVILTITFLILTLYAVLQSNPTLLPFISTRFLSFKILDTSSAASLFVTLLGALLVRNQFALGLLPRINYISTNSIKNDTSNPMASYETWRVQIRNSGLGAAIINRTEYVLELADERGSCFVGTYKHIVKELAKADLVCDRDYWLENFASGFALSPKDDSIAFEIKAEHMMKIKRLDMMLYFQSQLGNKYLREIFFIPHNIPKAEEQNI